MEQLRREMLYGLPNLKYLEFVKRHLLPLHKGPLVDPFMLDVPIEKIDAVYVDRKEVYNEIMQRGPKIILGATGSGKTTLMQKVYKTPRGRSNDLPLPLAVSLPLTRVNVSASANEFSEGKTSILTPEIVARSIFSTYWDQVLVSPQNRQDFLPTLRQDREWMLKLHWFYHHCSPTHRQILDDFELMTWLSASLPHQPFASDITPEDILRELIRFVTWPPAEMELFGPKRQWLYPRVQILLDETERLSNQAIIHLIQDIQKLYDLSLNNLDFKFFVDSNWRVLVENLDCVRQGRISLYELPAWHADELRKILAKRLDAKTRENIGTSGELTTIKQDESGISPGLNKQLNSVLLNCGPFDSDQQLRAVFVDARIKPWRNRLLDASSPSERVQMAIDRLNNQCTSEGENALALFLQVLGESVSPEDACHHHLTQLIKGLEYENRPTHIASRAWSRIDHTMNWAQEIPESRLSTKANEQFIDLIVEGALNANPKEKGIDAPIHALRLARVFLGACADCWEEYIGRPLEPSDLEEITHVYFGGEI